MILNRLESTADRLPPVRNLLAQLHQSLLQAERVELERERGRIGSGEYLGLLLHDPRFSWLRPMGRMVAKLDDVITTAEKTGNPISQIEAANLLDEVGSVVSLRSRLEGGFRYSEWLQRDPDVILAHGALSNALRPRPTAWAA
jgi:hypothetical protein